MTERLQHPNPSRRTRLQGRDRPDGVHSGRHEDPAVRLAGRAKEDAEARARLARIEELRAAGVSEREIANTIIREGRPTEPKVPLLLGDAEVVGR